MIETRTEERERLVAAADDPENRSRRLELLQLAIAYAEQTLERMRRMSQQHAQDRLQMVQGLATYSGPTGMNARYEIEVAAGSYWALAEMQLGGSRHRWAVSVDVNDGGQMTLDLDNNDVVPLGEWSCDHNPFDSN